MTLEVLKEKYAVCKLNQKNLADLKGEFVSLTISDNEISLVCKESRTPQFCTAETGYRAFRIAGVIEFSKTGILSGIAKILTEEKISIFAISTYDTDYFLVKQEALEQALAALSKNGYEIISKE